MSTACAAIRLPHAQRGRSCDAAGADAGPRRVPRGPVEPEGAAGPTAGGATRTRVAAHAAAGAESVQASAGMLFRFDPDERHAVAADGEARVLLVLSPWPAVGHYQPEERTGSGVSASSPDAA